MNIAIIPAAGSGSRIGGEVPKQFIEIAGAPILIHTIRRFDACPDINRICIGLSREASAFQSRIDEFGLNKPVMFVSGGKERSDSVTNALDAIAEFSPQIVVIHDAVRPFVTPELISAVVGKARLTGAAIAAQSATDTMKEAESGIIVGTLDRRRIFRAQTPQAFRYDLICRANQEARRSGLEPGSLTDDAMLVERLGIEVSIVEGPASNIKITTPEDLAFARFLLEAEVHR
jgi:2-C-methyl-D-erythritol 4-phosphate cytidylyltransferase